jgi:hypothetical protein
MHSEHEDFQKARKIARAIQDYFRQAFSSHARSTDIYHYLARHNLVENDLHQGIHFREFLSRLKGKGLLSLIPQCKCEEFPNRKYEWHFNKMSDDEFKKRTNPTPSKNAIITHQPALPIDEIDQLIAASKDVIEKLPKTDDSYFTIQQLEIRRNYPRAYETWISREEDYLIRALAKFDNIDKVAELLQRQPSAVKIKLEEIVNRKKGNQRTG